MTKDVKRHDFQLEVVRDPFIIARRERYGRTYLIRFGDSSETKGLEILSGGFIFTRLQIESFIGTIVSHWGKPAENLNSLGKDVLTSFDWHMYNGQSDRRASLIAATSALYPHHVREILKLLSNTVSRNSRFATFPNTLRTSQMTTNGTAWM